MTAPDLDRLHRQMRDRGYAFHRIPGPAPTMFQVLGERASGTNVVRKTIERNSTLFRTEGLGWKHGFPTMVAIPDNLMVVCAFRHAEAWARSMHKRPWHAHPDLQSLPFDQFLRSEWRAIVDRPADFEQIHPEMQVQGAALQYDRHPLTGAAFPNLFALRRAKMEAVLGMANRGCHFAWVQLEALQRDGAAFMADLRAAFDAPARRPEHRAVTQRLGNRFNNSVANRPQTPDSLSDADRAYLRCELDLQAESLLGYQY